MGVIMLKTIVVLAVWAGVVMPGTASAQAAAEGTYPGIISCDPGPNARGAMRGQITVEISGRQARYAVPGDGSPESGSGSMTGRQLVLTGQGRGYEARYVGEVGGQGGMLTGTRTGSGSRRNCQVLLGNGRG